MANDDSHDGRLKAFIEEVMQLERRYAHEKRNVVTERRSKLREIIEKFATVESPE